MTQTRFDYIRAALDLFYCELDRDGDHPVGACEDPDCPLCRAYRALLDLEGDFKGMMQRLYGIPGEKMRWGG